MSDMDTPEFGDLLYITTTPHCSAPITYLGTDDSGEVTLYVEGHIVINLAPTEGFADRLVRDAD